MTETIIENEQKSLLKEYEEQLSIAVNNYKNVKKKLEFAFDSFEEECIKEDMDKFRTQVKDFREKIDHLNNLLLECI